LIRARAILRHGLLAATLLAAAAPAALAGMGDAHSLVVRGRVVEPNGNAVPGAIVTTRGSYAVTATSDEQGHYTLEVPLGSAAGLRRGPFALEVRAEDRGRRLRLASGAPALSFEVSLLQDGSTVRVRSNLRDATVALAAAFSQSGETTAWVELDFGGAARADGSMKLDVIDDVDASGHAPPHPAPLVPTPAGGQPAPATSAVHESTATAPRSSLAAAREKHARGRSRKPRKQAAPARADSTALAARTPAKAPAPAPAGVFHLPSAGPMRVPATGPDPERVKPIEAFAPSSSTPFDTCACRLWGTVEIDWDRPLERNFPIELTLAGPATQRTEVEMFMGSPREFRLGPLPCGDYRLSVRPEGRYRYGIARGDSVLTVHCTGTMQVHIVLVPKTR
jgi:hypothetical protein